MNPNPALFSILCRVLKPRPFVCRRVLAYYGGEEDAFDMRKALSRDTEKKSVIPLKRPVRPDELWPTTPVVAA
jgi:hypothetical protein